MSGRLYSDWPFKVFAHSFFNGLESVPVYVNASFGELHCKHMRLTNMENRIQRAVGHATSIQYICSIGGPLIFSFSFQAAWCGMFRDITLSVHCTRFGCIANLVRHHIDTIMSQFNQKILIVSRLR